MQCGPCYDTLLELKLPEFRAPGTLADWGHVAAGVEGFGFGFRVAGFRAGVKALNRSTMCISKPSRA